MIRGIVLGTLLYTALFAALLAAQDGSPELTAAPPPAGACDEDVLAHVLADRLDTWLRSEPATVTTAAAIEDLSEHAQLLQTYRAGCAAATTYRTADGTATARVCLVAFDSYLNALGFFAAQRTSDARRVILTSNAYRQDGVLHVQSGRYYLRIVAEGATTEALPPDQHLAARLEVRLPRVEQLPRLLKLFPRKWLTALTLNYGPTDALGAVAAPMGLTVRHEIGAQPVSVLIIEAANKAEARRWYAAMLAEVLKHGPAYEMLELGEEAFWTQLGTGVTVGMCQDEFLVRISAAPRLNDAEALARLVGSAIRTSRPLPHLSP